MHFCQAVGHGMIGLRHTDIDITIHTYGLWWFGIFLHDRVSIWKDCFSFDISRLATNFSRKFQAAHYWLLNLISTSARAHSRKLWTIKRVLCPHLTSRVWAKSPKYGRGSELRNVAPICRNSRVQRIHRRHLHVWTHPRRAAGQMRRPSAFEPRGGATRNRDAVNNYTLSIDQTNSNSGGTRATALDWLQLGSGNFAVDRRPLPASVLDRHRSNGTVRFLPTPTTVYDKLLHASFRRSQSRFVARPRWCNLRALFPLYGV